MGRTDISSLEAQEIKSLFLTMTSSGEEPPLKLLALGKYVSTLSPPWSLTSKH